MDKRDLRVIKTKKAIRDTFLELKKVKSADRITVTELVEKAMIGKGTFYLHYQDIPQLYYELVKESFEEQFDAFDAYEYLLTDPPKFLSEFQKQIAHKGSDINILLNNLVEIKNYQALIIKTMVNKTFEKGILPHTKENELKLKALYGSFLTILPEHKDNKTIIDSIVTRFVQNVF